MYFKEVHDIWSVQQRFFSTLTNELRDSLIGSPEDPDPSGALFYQRSLKSQKHKVGYCIYELKKTRCCVSSFEYQEVEAYKFINSIEFSGS
jgi:CRISPR-associated endonuclease Csn1